MRLSPVGCDLDAKRPSGTDHREGEHVTERTTPGGSPHLLERPWGEVVWYTPASSDLWEELSRLNREAPGFTSNTNGAGQRDTGPASSPEQLALGPLLGDGSDRRVALMRVERQREEKPPRERFRWTLNLVTSPIREPPEAVRRLNAHFGGRQGAVDFVARAIALGGLPAALHGLRFQLSEAQWGCRLEFPRRVTAGTTEAAVLDGFCREAYVENVGYRLVGGANGIEEIVFTYLHETATYHVLANARASLKMTTGNWLPFADEVQELIVGTFFARREGTP